jgi:hypothetical protein
MNKIHFHRLNKGKLMVIDKREQKRFSLNLKARMSCRHTEDSTVIETVAANISPGGAFLKTGYPFDMASKVQIEFQLQYEDLKKLKFILSLETLKQLNKNKKKYIWVTATGVVIRREDNGVAIIFDTDYQITPLRAGGCS